MSEGKFVGVSSDLLSLLLFPLLGGVGSLPCMPSGPGGS